MLLSQQDLEMCAIGGTDVGNVTGLSFDSETWALRCLVVNTSNWWLGHKVLIAPQWIGGVWSDEIVTVNLSRETAKAAPPLHRSTHPDRQRETSLYTHYGHSAYWTAGSALEREL